MSVVCHLFPRHQPLMDSYRLRQRLSWARLTVEFMVCRTLSLPHMRSSSLSSIELRLSLNDTGADSSMGVSSRSFRGRALAPERAEGRMHKVIKEYHMAHKPLACLSSTSQQ